MSWASWSRASARAGGRSRVRAARELSVRSLARPGYLIVCGLGGDGDGGLEGSWGCGMRPCTP